MLKTYSRSQSQRSKSASTTAIPLPKEFVDSCRLCLTNKGSYEMFRSKIPLVTKEQIKFCTGIEVYEGDGLPAKLCQKCITYLLKFCSFKEKCLANEGKLKQLGNTSGIYQPTFPSKYLKDAAEPRRPSHVVTQRVKSEEIHSISMKNNEKILLEEDNISPDAPEEVISKVKKSPQDNNNYTILNGVKDIPLICQECKAPFSRLIDLINHHTRDHGWNRFYCAHCYKSFVTKSMLERHIRIHTGYKPFKCLKCHKRFSQKISAKRHFKTHLNLSYPCEHCPRILLSAEGLKCHVKTHHTYRTEQEMKKHKCKLCEKTFCHSSGLSRHLQRHMGKFFTCRVCLKHFQDASGLRRHFKEKHTKHMDSTVEEEKVYMIDPFAFKYLNRPLEKEQQLENTLLTCNSDPEPLQSS
ncbi:zinc finger protein 566-like isoform X2 [Cimex lectularius]|uniref:Uncharacterized protein n=1 Tax=Cimex lectularius TaxID=79782 RepID=A0A8I6SCK9_CIMLE|nr:zinc finger protein 566-like isoform X2 [Cimex lectularius]